MKEKRWLKRVLAGALLLAMVLGVLLAPSEVVRGQSGQTCCGFTDYTANPYGCGQCVWYASYRRSDIPDESWGIAAEWNTAAEDAGFSVGTEPRRGAIVVFEGGVAGAESAGHVAYVEEVFSDGRFRVSEMNWDCDNDGRKECYR